MKSLSSIYFLLFLAIILCACKHQEKTKLNLGFEKLNETSGKAVGWQYDNRFNIKVEIDNDNVFSGENSLRIENTSSTNPKYPVGAAWELYEIMAGQKIRLSGFIKTKESNSDSLGLFISYTDGLNEKYKFLRSSKLMGTNDWQKYEIELDIETEPLVVGFGAVLFGTGKIWVDGLKLYIDDKEIKHSIDPEFIASKKELAWLKNNCIPIKTVEAENGFDDLEPLKQLIGNSRIVALGENTHGSSEVFKMKHRLVEYLVSEMDFEIFSIEANMPEAYKVNDYILYGKGNPKDLLNGMYFWTWNTQEVLDMIMWMRKFNEHSEKKIQFTGFDMQYHKVALKNISEFAKNKHEDLMVLLQNFKRLTDKNSNSWTYTEEDILMSESYLQGISDYLTSNEANILQTVSEEEYNWLLQNLTILEQYIGSKNWKDKKLVNHRDKCMADNVAWIIENNPNAKVILWAHNGHIAKTKGWMGNHLSEKYKTDYYAIGFLSGTGTYTAVKGNEGIRSDNILKLPEPGSFEYSFHKTNISDFYFNFSKTSSTTPESMWLNSALNYRSIGARAMDNQFRRGKISEQFDAIIYIDQTQATNCFRSKY